MNGPPSFSIPRQAHRRRRKSRLDEQKSCNAAVEAFVNLLKRERIWRRTYRTRENAPQGMFDDIEMFYSPKRTRARTGGAWPATATARSRKLKSAPPR
ncbi:hypothetical protein C357_04452 [Citreicella sp. 357]|nr:hypothetical protein C357_04452 [Citreicella sp. 357]